MTFQSTILLAINLAIIEKNIFPIQFIALLLLFQIILWSVILQKKTSYLNIILSFFFLVVGFFGYKNANSLDNLHGTSLRYSLPIEYIDQTLGIFLLVSSIFLLFPKNETFTSSEKLSQINFNSKKLIWASLIPVVLGIYDVGFKSILHRGTHLTGSQTSYFGHIVGPMSLVAVGLLAFIAKTSTKKIKIVCFSIIVCYSLYFIALSSRRIVFIPFLVLYSLNMTKKYFAPALGITIFSSLYLFNFVLTIRGGTEHGLNTYFHSIVNSSNFHFQYSEIFQNIISSFQITGISAFVINRYPFTDLFVEMNPLPGNLAGWYNILDRHSINIYTPTSALGDLMNYGKPILFLIITLFAGVLNSLDLIVKKAMREGNIVYMGIVVGSLLIGVINSLQYSLRSTVRIFLYAAVLYFFSKIILNRKDFRRNFRS